MLMRLVRALLAAKMLQLSRFIGALLMLPLLMGMVWPGPAFAIEDALATASLMMPKARQSVFLDVTNLGTRLVAAGERGHIFYSDDAGLNWQQAQVPVSVTLTALFFPTSERGWAVGHDGVVLHTPDGGETWNKQLDGYEINQLVLDHAKQWLSDSEQKLANADEAMREALEEEHENRVVFWEDAQALSEEGASRPLLDLYFINDQEGFVIGAYNLILYTDNGGQRWTPWQIHLPNEEGFHYNAITGSGDVLYIVGELGTLYRSANRGREWERLNSPYEGSFFGVLADEKYLITFGLKGNAFRSDDQGDTWTQLETGTGASLTGGALLADGQVVLVGNGATIVMSPDYGNRWQALPSQGRQPFSSVTQADGSSVVVAGFTSLHRVALKKFQ